MIDVQRAAAIRACAALYGFAVAIALHDRFLSPAPPGQLPGLMTRLGYDAHASFRFAATLVVLPLVFAFAARSAAILLAAGQRWAKMTFAVACALALWTVTLVREPLWVALPPAVAIAAAIALRHFEARFTRRDAVLIPTGAALWLAITDVSGLGPVQHVLIDLVTRMSLRML